MTGAYKFTIHCEKSQCIMDVENHLVRAKTLNSWALRLMTIRSSCGTNERRMCDTIHPQIHDSDPSCPCGGYWRSGFAVRCIIQKFSF
ncbi:glucan biosynthesis protein [Escherichia coli]